MAGLSERRARLLDAVYRTFGEAATWSPVAGGAALTPTVIRAPGEQIMSFGDSEVAVPVLIVRVRRSEVAEPQEGDTVAVTIEGGGTDTVTLISRPRLKELGMEWLCEAKSDAA